MARVSGRKAGEAVVRSARGFVAEQVRLEQDAADEFREALAGPAAAVERLIRTRAADRPSALLEVSALDAILTLHGKAAREMTKAMAWWHWQVILASARHVRNELRWCEQKAGKGYAGIADRIHGRMMLDALSLQSAFADRTGGMPLVVGEDLLEGLRRQVRLASEAEDDVDTLVARVMSEEPVDAYGISGVGVWWRTARPFGANLMTSAVQASNLLRTAAMERWNETAEAS